MPSALQVAMPAGTMPSRQLRSASMVISRFMAAPHRRQAVHRPWAGRLPEEVLRREAHHRQLSGAAGQQRADEGFRRIDGLEASRHLVDVGREQGMVCRFGALLACIDTLSWIVRWLSGSLNTAAMRPFASTARSTGSDCGRDISRRTRDGSSSAMRQPNRGPGWRCRCRRWPRHGWERWLVRKPPARN